MGQSFLGSKVSLRSVSQNQRPAITGSIVMSCASLPIKAEGAAGALKVKVRRGIEPSSPVRSRTPGASMLKSTFAGPIWSLTKPTFIQAGAQARHWDIRPESLNESAKPRPTTTTSKLTSALALSVCPSCTNTLVSHVYQTGGDHCPKTTLSTGRSKVAISRQGAAMMTNNILKKVPSF